MATGFRGLGFALIILFVTMLSQGLANLLLDQLLDNALLTLRVILIIGALVANLTIVIIAYHSSL